MFSLTNFYACVPRSLSKGYVMNAKEAIIHQIVQWFRLTESITPKCYNYMLSSRNKTYDYEK
jgi:uncharacterized membrane protein